ncbi:MAG: substrate-binding domain-containing protein [Clostridiaceae bacterium]|jgi:GntR family transcriptional regulator of arabinose operon|nr:substrate-binding domain-containing protein [Clostridiaceae bacterium]
MTKSPKYMEIVNWTEKQIAEGKYKPNEKFLSESKLCETFGCSRQTIRRAFDILEQRKLITRIQGSGTYISSLDLHNSLKNSNNRIISKTIGLISTFLDNCVFPGIIRGIESVLSAEGYAVQLISNNNLVAGEARALQLMMKRDLDGLIVEPTRSALPCVNIDLYQEAIQSGLPLLFIDSFYSELSVPYIALDDEKAGYVATEYLIKKGHRNIVGIFPHSNRQAHLRYLGYVKALSNYQIPIQEHLIFWHSKEDMQQVIHGHPLYKCILEECTAVLCYNDVTAMMLISYISKNGINVPSDISVIGIDNSELAKFGDLTSIAHPADQLGEAAAKMILSMIQGFEGKTILFPPKLIERSSVREIILK